MMDILFLAGIATNALAVTINAVCVVAFVATRRSWRRVAVHAALCLTSAVFLAFLVALVGEFR